MVQTRRKNYNIVNHGTGNIDNEIINNSDETTLREVRISIISALFTLYYTFDLYIFEHFTNHHFFCDNSGNITFTKLFLGYGGWDLIFQCLIEKSLLY